MIRPLRRATRLLRLPREQRVGARLSAEERPLAAHVEAAGRLLRVPIVMSVSGLAIHAAFSEEAGCLLKQLAHVACGRWLISRRVARGGAHERRRSRLER